MVLNVMKFPTPVLPFMFVDVDESLQRSITCRTSTKSKWRHAALDLADKNDDDCTYKLLADYLLKRTVPKQRTAPET